MRMEVVVSAARFAAVRRAWDDLLARSARGHLFLTQAYLLAWWRHLAEEASMRVVLVWKKDRLVAAAPFSVRWGRWARMPVLKLGLIGAGWGYGGFLWDPEHPGALGRALREPDRWRGWHLLELSKLPAPSPEEMAALEAAFPGSEGEFERGWVPQIALSGTWEAYMAARSGGCRREWGRCARKLAERGEVRFVHVRAGEAAGEQAGRVVEWIERVAAGSWKAAAGTAITSADRTRGYYAELVRRLARAGMLEFGALLLGERPVAYALAGICRGRAMGIDSCYVQEHADCSPGVLAHNALVERCFGRGMAYYDFVDFHEYKLRLTPDLRETWSCRVVRRSFYPLALRWMRQRALARRDAAGAAAAEPGPEPVRKPPLPAREPALAERRMAETGL